MLHMTALLLANSGKHFSMIILLPISFLFLIYSNSVGATICEIRNTMDPLLGLKCVTPVVENVWHTSYHHCILQCLRMEKCRYINHKPDTGQCELGLGQCESLQLAAEMIVNAFGPPRDVCLHWGSSGQPGWVPVQATDNYAARAVYGDIVLIGNFYPYYGDFWSSTESLRIGPLKEMDHNVETLSKDADCPLPWRPYKAGEPLPSGAVAGGRHSDEAETYLIRVLHNSAYVFGYYHPNSALAYYEKSGVHMTTSMDLLVML